MQTHTLLFNLFNVPGLVHDATAICSRIEKGCNALNLVTKRKRKKKRKEKQIKAIKLLRENDIHLEFSS